MSVEEIIKAAKAAESEVLNKEVVTEDLNEEAKKKMESKDDFIDKTIEAKKNSAFVKRGEQKRKGFSSFDGKDVKKDEKEEKPTSYGYGGYGYGGYGYGFQTTPQKKDEKSESSKKAERVFKEAAKRCDTSDSEDVFSRHKRKKLKKTSKTKDGLKQGMLEALLDGLKTIVNALSEEE